MHFKRKKSKQSVRCTLCTPWRWRGNSDGRFKEREVAARRVASKEMADGRGERTAPDQSR